jgi:hypothetical protein
MDEILDDEETASNLDSESHDSMPSLEDIEDERHHEQDASSRDGSPGLTVGYDIIDQPPRYFKPDVSGLIPERFVPPLPTDTPQSLFVDRTKKVSPIVKGTEITSLLYLHANAP